LPDLYFAEDGAERFILRHGLEGPLVEQGRVLLKASNTDWQIFNEAPEQAKCGAAVLYERLMKPPGAALVECAQGLGTIVLCSINYWVSSRSADKLWREIFTNMGIQMGQATEGAVPAFDDNGALVNALSAGRFGGTNLEGVLASDFIGESGAAPTNGGGAAGVTWRPVASPSRDRFIFNQMNQAGAEDKPFAVYFSYWIRSPRALDDLLGGGPDAPRLSTFCYAADVCRLFLNGRELPPAHTGTADYRVLYVFENIPLRKDWNHFLIKVAASHLQGAEPGTLAVRIGSTREDFLHQIDSAVEPR